MHIPRPASEREPDPTPYAHLLDSSDEQIIRELRSGNNDAFAVVFRRYHRLVHITALRILRDAGEAGFLGPRIDSSRVTDNSHRMVSVAAPV